MNSSSTPPPVAVPEGTNPLKGTAALSVIATLVVAGIAETLTPGGVSSRLDNADFFLYAMCSSVALFIALTFAGDLLSPRLRLASLVLVPLVILHQAGGFKNRPSSRYSPGYPAAAQPSAYQSSPVTSGRAIKPLQSRWAETQRSCSRCSGSGNVDATCYACDSGKAPDGGRCSTCGGDGRKSVDCPSPCTNGTIYDRKEVWE